MILGCPRSNSDYLTYTTNVESSNTHNYVRHTKKDVMLDCFIDKFHVGSHVGQTIVNYRYKPKMGYLNDLRRFSLDASVSATNVDSRNMLQTRELTTSHVEGVTGISKKQIPFDNTASREFVTAYAFKITDPIEKVYSIRPHSKEETPLSQPQLHVDLFHTPTLNPSTENTDFQNSDVYYEVTYTMIVKQDISSLYTYGRPLPTDVIFHNNGTYIREGGAFMLGYWDGGVNDNTTI